MKILELSPLFKFCDLCLMPFMHLLNGFKKPIQETHTWHAYDVDKEFLVNNKGKFVKGLDSESKFDHHSSLGLYHMPILGGLTKYVVIEVGDFKDHWHVAWKGGDKGQIHRLKIYDNKLKLLTGRTGGYFVFALNDKAEFLDIKIIDYGKIGDKKYPGVRLL